MSTSIADVTCADVSSERRMWSAMPRLIAVIGSSGSPRSRRLLAGRDVAQGCRLRRCGPVAAADGLTSLRRGRRAGLDEGLDVLLRHAAAGAGARHLRRVDPVLGGDARDDRRDERPAVLGRRRRLCRLRRRLGDLRSPAPRIRPLLPASPARAPGAGSAAGAAAPASPPMRASTVPTSTVSPSWTRISLTTPGGGRRHLGVDLVGRDLEQRLVGLDRDRRPA